MAVKKSMVGDHVHSPQHPFGNTRSQRRIERLDQNRSVCAILRFTA